MRISALFPAATEMVCALGAADMLVGISHDSDFPSDFLHPGIPRVTRSTIDSNATPAEIDRMVRVSDTLGEALHVLDAETISRLEPHLIITQGICDVCAIRESDVRIIAESLWEPPVVLSLSADSLEEMMNDIRRVGAAIERSPLAEVLVTRLEDRLRKGHERLVVASVPRPRVAVLEWTDPLYNAGHWVPQRVRRAGGIGVLGKAGAGARVAGAGPSGVELGAAMVPRDQSACGELYDRDRRLVFSVALRVTNDRAAAEDVAHDLFLQLWRTPEKFDGARGQLAPWLAVMARNRAIDVVRKKGETSIEEEPTAMEVAADSPDPLARREMTEELKRLLECVGRLEPDRQKLVLLAYYNGWSREQLAAKFETPVNTVKTWLRRSMMDIRECLGLG